MYKEINCSNWDFLSRLTDEYIARFIELANNIDYPLLAYLEKPIMEKINKYKFNSNIFFTPLENVTTFYNKFLDIDKKIIESKIYKNKIPISRKKLPEHKYSKINFIFNAKRLYPNYTFYYWIDFGFITNKNNIPCNLKKLYINL